MTVWRAKGSAYRFVLLALPVVCLVVLVWLWGLLGERTAQVDFDPGVFLLGVGFFVVLLVAGLLVYVAWCAFSVGYALDETTLFIMAGGVTYAVALGGIGEVHAPGAGVGGERVGVR